MAEIRPNVIHRFGHESGQVKPDRENKNGPCIVCTTSGKPSTRLPLGRLGQVVPPPTSEISEKVHSGAPEILDSWHMGSATSANQAMGIGPDVCTTEIPRLSSRAIRSDIRIRSFRKTRFRFPLSYGEGSAAGDSTPV